MAVWTNWSGHVRAAPKAIVAPPTEEALRQVVAEASGEVRIAGSGHSFTPLCATNGTLVTLDAHAGVVSHDSAKMTATVRGGTKIHAMGLPLHERGLALLNQGDIDRQAIAGALATGTHGTGVDLGSLSTAITALRLVLADGSVIFFRREEDPDLFGAARVGLGALGVISEATLECRAPYRLRERGWVAGVQEIFRDLSQLKTATRHFEFWWFPYADDVIAKSLEETDAPARPLRTAEQMASAGKMSADQKAFKRIVETARFLPFLSPRFNRQITEAAREGFSRYANAEAPVRWSHEAFPSPRLVRFNEMEFSVPAEKGPDCAREIAEMIRKKRIAVAFPLEYRFVKGDDIWLSPFYGRDSVSLSVHQYAKQSYRKLFDACEAIFRAYGGRPHWGKLHSHGAKDFARLYPKWDDFLVVRARLDPAGKFLNAHLRDVFGLVKG